MRKNFGAKAMCYPMPVFIIGTYNADGTPNAMNAAWGGISEETEISICIDSALFPVSFKVGKFVQVRSYKTGVSK